MTKAAWRKPHDALWLYAGLHDVASILDQQDAARMAMKQLRRHTYGQKRNPQGRLWHGHPELRGMFRDSELQTALYKLLDRFKTNPAYQDPQAVPILMDVVEGLEQILGLSCEDS
jgi:hypothetical protein